MLTKLAGANCFCLVVLSIAVVNTSLSAQETIPIQGWGVGNVSLVPISISQLRFQVDYHMIGQISDVGAIRSDFTTPDAQIDFQHRTITAHTPEWSVNLIIDNGDQIQGRYLFPSSVIPFSRLGFFSISGIDAHVLGGSGQFEGAVGKGTARTIGNIYLRVFVIAFDAEVTTEPPGN